MRPRAFTVMIGMFVTNGSPSSLKTKYKGWCSFAERRIEVSCGEGLPSVHCTTERIFEEEGEEAVSRSESSVWF